MIEGPWLRRMEPYLRPDSRQTCQGCRARFRKSSIFGRLFSCDPALLLRGWSESASFPKRGRGQVPGEKAAVSHDLVVRLNNFRRTRLAGRGRRERHDRCCSTVISPGESIESTAKPRFIHSVLPEANVGDSSPTFASFLVRDGMPPGSPRSSLIRCLFWLSPGAGRCNRSPSQRRGAAKKTLPSLCCLWSDSRLPWTMWTDTHTHAHLAR